MRRLRVLACAQGAARAGRGVAMAAAANAALDRRPLSDVFVPLAGIAAAGFVLAGLALVWEARSAGARTVFEAGLRRRLYRQLVALGPGYAMSTRTGALQATMVEGTDDVAGHLAGFAPRLTGVMAGLAVTLAVTLVIDPVVFAVALGGALLAPAARVVVERSFADTSRRFWATFGELAGGYLDAIQGLPTLRAFGARERWGQRLQAVSEDLRADAAGLSALTSMHVGFVSLGVVGGGAGGAAAAAWRLSTGALGTGGALAAAFLLLEAFRSLADLLDGVPQAYVASAAAQAIGAIMEEAVTAPAPAAAPAPSVAGAGTGHPSTAPPGVCFEDVFFRYAADRPPAAAGLSFTVEPGETVAVVGRSGAGKTTAMLLLLGFFTPERGRIRIGGADISGSTSRTGLVAPCFQDPYLFDATVADNLRLGRPEATIQDLEEAARAAGVHEAIEALPTGYETRIGERGGRLSGGQRQRLALARALVSGAPVLVLDEPTASVDATSEAEITEALRRLAGRRTVVVIAHHLSTIRHADRAVVIEAGRVVQHGTPQELLAAGGAFARLMAPGGGA